MFFEFSCRPVIKKSNLQDLVLSFDKVEDCTGPPFKHVIENTVTVKLEIPSLKPKFGLSILGYSRYIVDAVEENPLPLSNAYSKII